ncbi:ribonuclease III [Schaalia sp. 19OD2882]|uniref:ribonuclease III n=1 Tax=Schaalia sp. 19OD2882 TaxID=2794089 RepID=UPI001C1EC160|nr:ribonuclease III [Schaalia sp. 19OD2882]QWW18904.1 ribonuclease III [Schaalia sp. 19OD2882]
MARKSRLPEPVETDTSKLIDAWGAEVDPDLLALALVHRSWANEAGGVPNNERLEFLGDSVLSIVATERLFIDHPDLPESDLSRMRAASVSQEPLARAARAIGLGDFVRLGKGESRTGGADKDSILSDTFEALIGATYLTHGLDVTRQVVLRHVGPLLIKSAVAGAARDFKTVLLEIAAARSLGEVSYEVEGEGPDHARHYTARAFAGASCLGRGEGASKKHAEFAAAADAVAALEAEPTGI